MEVAAFVDESFDSFFDLTRDDGYFCMGVVIVPVAELATFEQRFLNYRQTLASAKGLQDDGSVKSELKSKSLRTLDTETRRQAIAPLIEWASGCGAAVGGFYTTTGGYLNYSLRSNQAAEQQLHSGIDDPELVKQAREDIIARRATAHAESLMIGDVAQVLAGMLLHYCGDRELEFSIRYDPREAEEDRRVFERIDTLIHPLESAILDRNGVYLGCRNDEDSNNSCGVQMADHVTRDLRQLFHQNPRLLTDGSSRELITPDVEDVDNTILTTIAGKPYKWGDSIPMASDLVRQVFGASAPFSLADYHTVLMKQRVSCYSESGEARIVNFENFLFENMVD